MMKLFRRLILLVVTTPAFATTYYVATTGSDSNPGTLVSPWLTLQHAANTMVAGDTTLVQNGVYTAATQNPNCTGGENTGKGMISPARSGTSSSYITFKSQNKWGAVLDGQGGPWNVGCAEAWKISGSYIRIQDFEMRGFLDDAVDNYQGGTNLNIIGNWIHHIGRYCNATGTGRDGIFVWSGPITIEQNVLSDIGKYDPGENGCVAATSAPPPIPSNPETGTDWFWQQNDHPIYIAGGGSVMIRNNIFYRNEHGYSVQNYPYGAAPTISILNNIFLWCDNHTGYNSCVIMDGAGTLRMDNNIFYDPVAVPVYFAGASALSSCTLSNNLTSNNNGLYTGSGGGSCTVSGNILNTDPQLVAYGSQTVDSTSVPDAHETSSSPTLGKGVTLTDVTNDFAGNPRPAGSYDIGAYQFITGTASAPNPPANLTVVVH